MKQGTVEYEAAMALKANMATSNTQPPPRRNPANLSRKLTLEFNVLLGYAARFKYILNADGDDERFKQLSLYIQI